MRKPNKKVLPDEIKKVFDELLKREKVIQASAKRWERSLK